MGDWLRHHLMVGLLIVIYVVMLQQTIGEIARIVTVTRITLLHHNNSSGALGVLSCSLKASLFENWVSTYHTYCANMNSSPNRKSFRARRIDNKKPMKILWEHEASDIEDYSMQVRAAPPIETGVEKEEEEELHLQAVLNSTEVALRTGNHENIASIPTPCAKRENPDYQDLYKAKNLKETATYIKYSAEIEESTGCPYTLTDDDLDWIQKYNDSKPDKEKLEEDELEWMLYQFELIANRRLRCKRDPKALPSIQEMERTFTGELLAPLRLKLPIVYSYWMECRIKRGGGAVAPVVMTEPANIQEEENPYVCFRRRELKPMRKTRRTDAKSLERCDKLHLNLTMGAIVLESRLKFAKRRREIVANEMNMFNGRLQVKQFSRGLGIEENVSGKPPKKKVRKLSHSSSDKGRKSQSATSTQCIEARAGWIDSTDEVFEPLRKPPPIEYYQLYSASEDDFSSDDSEPLSPLPERCAFRTRIGRGGRIFTDRRGFRPRADLHGKFRQKFKYDDMDEFEIFSDEDQESFDKMEPDLRESPIKYSLLNENDITELICQRSFQPNLPFTMPANPSSAAPQPKQSTPPTQKPLVASSPSVVNTTHQAHRSSSILSTGFAPGPQSQISRLPMVAQTLRARAKAQLAKMPNPIPVLRGANATSSGPIGTITGTNSPGVPRNGIQSQISMPHVNNNITRSIQSMMMQRTAAPIPQTSTINNAHLVASGINNSHLMSNGINNAHIAHISNSANNSHLVNGNNVFVQTQGSPMIRNQSTIAQRGPSMINKSPVAHRLMVTNGGPNISANPFPPGYQRNSYNDLGFRRDESLPGNSRGHS
ncbi:hypothetical protein G9A89_015229 [Geosiphon pyriformis]|nr:hypothetical protein G9A89_015229 [Geosiphon pyriformis]